MAFARLMTIPPVGGDALRLDIAIGVGAQFSQLPIRGRWEDFAKQSNIDSTAT